MDGAPTISAEVSMGKARTSAMTKRPSKFFEDRVKERPAFANFPAGILIQGAVPLIHQNECVGAIGVSGRAVARGRAGGAGRRERTRVVIPARRPALVGGETAARPGRYAAAAFR